MSIERQGTVVIIYLSNSFSRNWIFSNKSGYFMRWVGSSHLFQDQTEGEAMFSVGVLTVMMLFGVLTCLAFHVWVTWVCWLHKKNKLQNLREKCVQGL